LSRYGYQDRYVFFMDHLAESTEEVRPRTRLVEAHGIVFCLSGRMRALVEGSEYRLGPDDLLLVRDAEAHTFKIDDYPCEYVMAYFSLHYFYLFDPQYRLIRPFADRPLGTGNYIQGSRINVQLLKQCFQNIASIADIYMRRIAVMGALTVTLSEINRAFENDRCPFVDERPELMRNILNFINDHYTEHLEPDEIAANLFVSRSQIDRIIKQATGYSLWHYIITKRLIRARHLLHEGVMIKEAASRSGFSDYSTFYKAYTKWNSAPPKTERPSEESDPMLRNFYQQDETSRLL
jgi:AraC-like DNA-binding protein